jgi:hypothetical protein
MRTVRTIFAVLALVLIIYTLFEFNYKNFSWQANRSNYLLILSMAFVIIGMFYSNISDAKKRKKD